MEGSQVAYAEGSSRDMAEGDDTLKRRLELSAYFTVPKLDVSHRQLALMAAMKLAVQSKQLSSALSFANRVIANGGASKMVDQVSSLLHTFGTIN